MLSFETSVLLCMRVCVCREVRCARAWPVKSEQCDQSDVAEFCAGKATVGGI